MKRVLFSALCLSSICAVAQPVELDIFQQDANATTATVGIRVRAVGPDVQYQGATFYLLYQNPPSAPQSAAQNTVIGVDDSRMVVDFGWGIGTRFTNPSQAVSIDPGAPGGNTYNRRYVYGNSDETGGSNIQTLTTAWDTLLYITLNTSGLAYPQGGYAYIQETLEAGGVALTDIDFNNIAINVVDAEIPLGPVGLPVTFTNYTVLCTDRGTRVNWTTANEVGASHFEIQKSDNGVVWNTIGNVGATNSNTTKSYQFVDGAGGAAYYRLRQVDVNGNFTYTAVVRTSCGTKQFNVILHPVPASHNLFVKIYSERTAQTDLQVFDIQGRIVKRIPTTINNGNNSYTINVSDLAAGEYILRSADPSIEINKKFIIAR